MAKLTKEQRDELRAACEADLETFVRAIAPHRVLGAVHSELFRWWQREDAKDNQLVLLPRDHGKSAMMAYRVAWWITKHPDATVLYVSATANLAEKQLKAIKDILTSDIYRYLWPEMINENEGKREKWSMDAIAVDHPKRKAEGVRDDTVKAAGITANVTGLHCTIAVLDDVVVPDNAYTETGREQVRAFYSQLSSIESTGAKEWCVGTRYHPGDLYKDMMEMVEIYYNRETEEDVELPVYEVFERVVETNGEFLWPKQRRSDGKTFGFDEKELARKKAKYLDVTQFYCFTPDTLAYTDQGHKLISSVEVGDSFGGNKVANKFIRDIAEDIAEVSVYGVPHAINVTYGHKFPIRSKTVKKDYGTSNKQIGDWLNKQKTERWYLAHSFETKVIDTPFEEDVWWLIGHWLAEGYVWKKYVALCTRNPQEKGIHDKINSILHKYGIHSIQTVTKANTRIFLLDWPELLAYLRNFGYYSYGKHLNDEAKYASKEKQEQLIQGYLLGDGFTLTNQVGFGITSVNLRLLEEIKDVLLRLGHIPYIVQLYGEGREAFGYKCRECFSIRWYGTTKSRNFIENGTYYQLIQKVIPTWYNGPVHTLEVENTHQYNVYGLTCQNSQYYNNPNAVELSIIDKSRFNYYEKSKVENISGTWHIGNKDLTIYAAMDFAYSISNSADYTAIVVVGVDEDYNYYVLDIDRFKTNKISVMYEHAEKVYRKWRFRKLRAEAVAAQRLIVQQFKDFMRSQSVVFSIDEYFPPKTMNKAERIASVLEPRYQNGQMFHYQGGNCQILEEELLMNNPEHDDVKDALASCVEIAKPSISSTSWSRKGNVVNFNNKWGGVAMR